jgi:hypothetical protein
MSAGGGGRSGAQHRSGPAYLQWVVPSIQSTEGISFLWQLAKH